MLTFTRGDQVCTIRTFSDFNLHQLFQSELLFSRVHVLEIFGLSPLCNWCFFFYRGPNYLFMLSIRQLILSQSKDGEMNGVRDEVRSH